jgi:hypothetical protein
MAVYMVLKCLWFVGRAIPCCFLTKDLLLAGNVLLLLVLNFLVMRLDGYCEASYDLFAEVSHGFFLHR